MKTYLISHTSQENASWMEYILIYDRKTLNTSRTKHKGTNLRHKHRQARLSEKKTKCSGNDKNLQTRLYEIKTL